MIALDDLLNKLEYFSSPHFRTKETQFEPESVHLFRAAVKSNNVKGVYVFRTSPKPQSDKEVILAARPAVFVAEAETTQEAKEIHRALWNLGYAPFIIIMLRNQNQIKLYTGFDYSEQSDDQGILNPYLDLEQILEILHTYFSASAIDSGRIWKSEYAESLNTNRRVDRRLLKNLKELSQVLQDDGLPSSAAHALIGKYVYLYYLRHRNIISDLWFIEKQINNNTIFGREATRESLYKIDSVLKDRFFEQGGDVFPLNYSHVEDRHVRKIAKVFIGDSINSGQLHLDFPAYRFEYIPIELLSSIYEQFLHEQEAGKQQGVIYTPEFLADYLLSEINSISPLKQGMKILDPACGSGVFLVLAYRRLIENQLVTTQKGKLSPKELGKILEDSIYGVEVQEDACYLTEFSLTLTLLNYVDPPDLDKNKDFRFPNLHNQQIFECDFFDNESIFWKSKQKFDLIVGNPPWVKANASDQKNANDWIIENQANRPVADRRVVEAFSWRVSDLLKPDGVIGLIHYATSLHSVGHHNTSKKYREKFFKAHMVFRITNFSNLRNVLFYGTANQPAVTIVYKPSSSTEEKPYINHFGPFSINQDLTNRGLGRDNRLWVIIINENEVSYLSPYEAEKGDAAFWKLALWGSHRDKRAMDRLQRIFPESLSEFCRKRGWGDNLPVPEIQLKEKPDSKNPIEKLSYFPELAKEKVLDKKVINQLGSRFSVPPTALVNNSKCYVRRGENSLELTSQAPHLVLSGAWTYFLYSEDDFILTDRSQLGIGADWSKKNVSEEDKVYLKALSVFLSTSLVEYYLFFQCPEWAVSGLHKGSRRVLISKVREIPTPNFTFEQAQNLADLYEKLAQTERQIIKDYSPQNNQLELDTIGQVKNKSLSKRDREKILRLISKAHVEMRPGINLQVYNMMNVPVDITVLADEFVETRLPLDGRYSTLAVIKRPPTTQDLEAYGLELREELDDFLMGKFYHSIIIEKSNSLIRCIIEIKKVEQQISIQVRGNTPENLYAQIHRHLRDQFSQWVYVQRELRIIEPSTIQIFKQPRLINWTKTQAMNDASDIIGEVLSQR